MRGAGRAARAARGSAGGAGTTVRAGGAACAGVSTTGGSAEVTAGGEGGAAVITAGEREPRNKTSVTSSTALAPRIPIRTQSHQRGLVAKNAGRRTEPGATTPLAFSSSARLRAS